MKLYKLSQGNTLENLKHFIYITNEYGKPSSEFIDSFIDNFGKIVLIGNFTLNNSYRFDVSTGYAYKELDILWKEIEQDCKDNQTDCTYNYGSLFYYIIGSKAVNILKDTIGEQEWNSETQDNKLLYLKTFIEDFDKYIAEEYQLEFDKLVNNVETETVTQDRQETKENQINVKNYRLKEEYSSTKSEESLIDCNIDFDNDVIGTIVSSTEIRIDNETLDIGEYIEKNNININSVTIGAYWFTKVYEQY